MAVGFGVGLAVRSLLRDAACAVRLGVGLAVALGEALTLALALALGEAVGEPVVRSLAPILGERSIAAGRTGSDPAVSWTAPTVPPTASATATTALAARPAGEVILRVRECLPVTGPVLSSTDQIGSDHNERSTSEVNVIMMV
ncbi:hypothetical protein Xph01_43080 [Micromonospora phaseoli]|nr:hypothetical protein Xph01_43080 [Micromonospora phaseoli]